MYEGKTNLDKEQNNLNLENDKFKLLTEAIQLNTEELKTLKSKLAYIAIDEVVELNNTIITANEDFRKNIKTNKEILCLNIDFHQKLQHTESAIELKMKSLIKTIPKSITINKKISLDNTPKSLISLFGFLVILVTVILGYKVASNAIDKKEDLKYRKIYNKVYQLSTPHNQKIMDELYYKESNEY